MEFMKMFSFFMKRDRAFSRRNLRRALVEIAESGGATLCNPTKPRRKRKFLNIFY